MPAGGMPSGVVEGVDPVRHEYPALRSLEQILEASAQNAADEWTYPQRELTGEIYPAEAWPHSWPYTSPGDFRRLDEAVDTAFYHFPKLVCHMDEAAIAALTRYYDTALPARADALDLCSSWTSHFPCGRSGRRTPTRLAPNTLHRLEPPGRAGIAPDVISLLPRSTAGSGPCGAGATSEGRSWARASRPRSSRATTS